MRIGLFCKTFCRDLSRFERLYRSIEAHDRDRLPFLVSVPEADLRTFVGRFGCGRIEFVTDEKLVGGPLRQSWRSQQLVKFNSWRVNISDALLMLDSDFYFIRDFGADDLKGPDGTPLFVISREWHKYDPANNRLLSFLRGENSLDPVTRDVCLATPTPSTSEAGTIPRWRLLLDRLTSPPVDDRVKRIRALFWRKGPDYYVMPGPIWPREAQLEFRSDFLLPRGLTYGKLIQFAPWEYVWLAEWMLARGLPGVTPARSMFLHFASDKAIEHARAQGFTTEEFARNYLGLVLASGHDCQRVEAF